MQIDKFVPYIYDKNTEIKALISAEKKEFQQVFEAKIQTDFKNTFIATADLAGIELYVDIRCAFEQSDRFLLAKLPSCIRR